MEDTKVNLCKVCGTPMVPAIKRLTRDGALRMDGSLDFSGNVCPKCHPDLVGNSPITKESD